MHIGEVGHGGTTDPALHARQVAQMEAAAARHRASQAERDAIARRRASGMRFPDAPEELGQRARRLMRSGHVPGEVLRGLPADGDPVATDERIIGDSRDLQSVVFLARGVRASATVGRIWVRAGGRLQPGATGFLVAPRLLLTNHHVFPDAASAEDAFVEFGADAGLDDMPVATVKHDFTPGDFFFADEHLDYALVALAPGPDGRAAGEVFGWNRLDPSAGKHVIGDPVNIVGHPSGRLKEICIRDNELIVRLDEFLHYRTDTEPGNSGSPVFNDQWEVIALHHRGVPATDDQGRLLNVDGGLWSPEQGDAAVQWVANEGSRISAVVGHLVAHTPPEAHAVLAELGPAVVGSTAEHVAPASASGAVPASRTESSGPTGVAGVGAGVPAPRVAEAAPVLTGIAGRADAFGATRQLVFLHGRSQHGRAPEALRGVWASGLNSGLGRLGYAAVDAADVFFPYYGDRLAAALRTQETVGTTFDAVAQDPAAAAAPVSGSARELYTRLLDQAAQQAGMPSGMSVGADEPPREEGLELPGDVVRLARRPLDWLARHSGVDRLVVASAFRDVALYLDDGRIRDDVLACVRETVPTTGGIVLVAHSLGTVIAMDLLTTLPDSLGITGLVTLGAPLGLDTVYDRLLTGGPHCPQRVPWWFNAWAPSDAVAIGCPLRGRWSGVTAESSVDNPRDRAHDIDEYLARPEVAGALAERLGLPRR
ncbi:MAG TPA: serine protease [Yinghuangia sp.]|uniref:trypsin-like peptidase domain-containing protein n=1 Tax=Yinghuangia sp. YIM S10712 TaxID=3436930 RepID=UPI002C353BBF|nr:serine protease [Yinghuangia sp.]